MMKYKNKAYFAYYCIAGKIVHPLTYHEAWGGGGVLSFK